MSIVSPQQPADDASEALKQAIKDVNEVLVTATTMTPLHKKTLTLTRTKLFTEEHSGLGMISVTHLSGEDLLNVDGSIGPLSGFISLTTRLDGPSAPIHIGPFHRKDALTLKRILQGYITARQRRIDLGPIPVDQLKAMLYELGVDDRNV